MGKTPSFPHMHQQTYVRLQLVQVTALIAHQKLLRHHRHQQSSQQNTPCTEVPEFPRGATVSRAADRRRPIPQGARLPQDSVGVYSPSRQNASPSQAPHRSARYSRLPSPGPAPFGPPRGRAKPLGGAGARWGRPAAPGRSHRPQYKRRSGALPSVGSASAVGRLDRAGGQAGRTEPARRGDGAAADDRVPAGRWQRQGLRGSSGQSSWR